MSRLRVRDIHVLKVPLQEVIEPLSARARPDPVHRLSGIRTILLRGVGAKCGWVYDTFKKQQTTTARRHRLDRRLWVVQVVEKPIGVDDIESLCGKRGTIRETYLRDLAIGKSVSNSHNIGKPRIGGKHPTTSIDVIGRQLSDPTPELQDTTARHIETQARQVLQSPRCMPAVFLREKWRLSLAHRREEP